MRGLRVGIDVGGTFTDVVGLRDGLLVRRKLPSTPGDFAAAVLEGLGLLLEDAGASGADVREVIHGTTVATNAIVEKKGARTGLITTRGFRDVLEIGRLRTPRLYDLTWRKPPPLVPRELRREVEERVMSDGTVLTPLDDSSVREAIALLRSRGVEAVAVCLLNSFANPAHELRVAELVSVSMPGCPVSVSHQVLPEMREYERTSTTVINAYIQPVVAGYLETVERGLRALGVEAPLLVMQSNGGVVGSELARWRPVHVVESGPAAGVMGTARLGTRLGHPNIISFDMGGTTAKAATIRDGEPDRLPEYEVGGELHMGHHLMSGGGYVLRTPSVGLAEVGAGGGSIVWLDRGGVLQVGPQSAGAQPGPACYAAGGTRPTITDANVVLGYLNPESLLGGALKLDAAAAERALVEGVGRPKGMDALDAAYGAFLVANSKMIRAVRAVTTEKGRDPSDFVLYAFGGSGPVHAVEMARQLGVATVVVPPAPGLFSSLGLLFADVEHHFVRTLWRDVPQGVDPRETSRLRRALEDEALATLLREGFPPERVDLAWHADMRYRGQKYELAVPLAVGWEHDTAMEALAERFMGEHLRVFGYRSDEQVQLVNIRLAARGVPDAPRMPERLPPAEARRRREGRGLRTAYFGPAFGRVATPVVGRGALSETPAEGPLIVEEYDSTTVVPPGAAARRDDYGDIVIAVDTGRR